MARPGFHNHPKFRRLVFLLKEPISHVRGYLECLWDVAYENGDSTIGDKSDVELAAQYPGEPGKLADALLGCGGKRVGLIEAIKDSPDTYQIHDLFDHCPEYVRKRHRREMERKSSNGKDSDCRSAGSDQSSADNGFPPAPAPAPAPTITPIAPATVIASRSAGANQELSDGGDGFSKGWGTCQAKLSSLGASRWKETIADAKANGCTPGHVMELFAFAKANGYATGAVVYRVTRARMTLPVADGWPPKPPEPETLGKAAKRADKAKREAAIALADAIIKQGRRAKKSDEEIKSELAQAGLEWPK